MINFLAENMMFLWILIPIVVLVIISLVILLLVLKKRNKKPKIKIDETFINELLTCLGGKDNVESVQMENGRLKFSLNSLDGTNLEGLKSLANNGVFVTGNIVKTLFKFDSAAIKKALDSLI